MKLASSRKANFSSKELSTREIQGIFAVYGTSAIGRETMLDFFRRGKVLPEGRTNEEELKLLAAPAVSTVRGSGR